MTSRIDELPLPTHHHVSSFPSNVDDRCAYYVTPVKNVPRMTWVRLLAADERWFLRDEETKLVWDVDIRGVRFTERLRWLVSLASDGDEFQVAPFHCARHYHFEDHDSLIAWTPKWGAIENKKMTNFYFCTDRTVRLPSYVAGALPSPSQLPTPEAVQRQHVHSQHGDTFIEVEVRCPNQPRFPLPDDRGQLVWRIPQDPSVRCVLDVTSCRLRVERKRVVSSETLRPLVIAKEQEIHVQDQYGDRMPVSRLAPITREDGVFVRDPRAAHRLWRRADEVNSREFGDMIEGVSVATTTTTTTADYACWDMPQGSTWLRRASEEKKFCRLDRTCRMRLGPGDTGVGPLPLHDAADMYPTFDVEFELLRPLFQVHKPLVLCRLDHDDLWCPKNLYLFFEETRAGWDHTNQLHVRVMSGEEMCLRRCLAAERVAFQVRPAPVGTSILRVVWVQSEQTSLVKDFLEEVRGVLERRRLDTSTPPPSTGAASR